MTDQTKKIAKQGMLYTICTFGGNILNLVFNFYLGKVLSVEIFSLIALYLGIQYSIGIFFHALNFTVINTISSALAELKTVYAAKISSDWSKISLVIGTIFAVFWLAISPWTATLWNVEARELYLFSLIFIFGSLIFINRGILLASLRFTNAAIVFLSESLTKLLIAAALVLVGFYQYAYASIPLSILIAYLVSHYFIRKENLENSAKEAASKTQNFTFPKNFYFFSLMLGLSTLTFLSIDVILAKAFFSPSQAGAYALLGLSGKIIFLFSSIIGSMFIPYFSSNEKRGEYRIDIFRLFIAVTSVIIFGSSLFFILFGPQLFLLFFGQKIAPILGFFTQYVLSIAAFSLSYALVLYRQSKKQYLFPIISSASSLIFVIGAIFFHQSLAQFITVFSIVSVLNFAIIFIFHLLFKREDATSADTVSVTTVQAASRLNSNKVTTVTIGIPAYNEEANIGRILNSVINQKEPNFVIEKIIVASDGSQDNTVPIINEFDDKRIMLLDGKKNRGLNFRHNQIMRLCTSDILVLLNADLSLDNDQVVQHLVEPLITGEADFSAQWAKPVPARTLIESILNTGFELKYYIYCRLKGGNNIYTCVGHMRALSRLVYSNTIFPLQSEGEDQFLYLSCIAKGYKYKHAHKACARFRLPSTWSDYKHYARRIFQTQRKHKDLIEEHLVNQERLLPPKLLLEGLVFSIIRRPLHSLAYVVIHVFMQKWALSQAENNNARYKVSATTKQLFFPDE